MNAKKKKEASRERRVNLILLQFKLSANFAIDAT